MAALPTYASTPAVRAAGHHERDRSFTVEQFGDLVSSALDVHRPPDSTLAFSFGGNVYPSPCRSTRLRDSQETPQAKTGTFTRLRGAFTRKFNSYHASANMPPDARRLTSSSVPVLSHLQLQTIPFSASLTSLELDGYDLDSPPNPATPADSASFPSISIPPSQSHGAPEKCAFAAETSIPDVPQAARSYSSTRSLFNLKPLTIPKLTKKSSRVLSSPLPTPSAEKTGLIHTDSPVVNVDLSCIESEGMRSFFDDSGYESPKMTKKKSKASFRSFFSSNPSGSKHPPVPSRYKQDKALPPTPVTEKRASARPQEYAPVKDALYTQTVPLADPGSLFYTPPAAEHRVPDKRSASDVRGDAGIRSEKELGAHRVSNWISRSANSTPRKAKRIVRSSPPSYPSPTSPLPPTPELLLVGLPAVSSQPNSDHIHVTECVGDTSEESVDSMEILSWRMPVLEQQISKTSANSSVYAHALGRPSRNSIRERLDLGPRLHLNVPLAAQWRPNPSMRSKSQDGLSPASSDRDWSLSRLTIRPSSSISSSPPRMPISRLTSASLVSLISIATVTAGSKAACDEDKDGDRKDALDRAFTPEDDPFAAGPLTPLTPVSPMFHTHTSKKEKYHSFMPLGNDSSLSTGAPKTPTSDPASPPSWYYRLGSNSNMSSPALAPSFDNGTTLIPKSTKASTSPSSVRSGLSPSLIDALGARRRTPSTPSFPPSSCRNLGQVLSRVRKVQNSQDGHSKSKLSGGSEGNGPRIVGHTESRPNSPFPLLFLRSQGAKVGPVVTKESKRTSVVSDVSDGTDERAVEYTAASQPVSRIRELLLVRRVQERVKDPLSPSANDADAFGDAARDIELEGLRRDLVSPTAWLLDSDDYDEEGRNTHEADALADKSTVLALNVGSSGKWSDLRDAYGGNRDAIPASTKLHDLRRASLPQAYCETESETETEGNITLLRASQSWPLPPHRTVVVDEESGEGYHVVEPDLEYVQAGSVSHTPRHSIRFPKRHSGAVSIGSHSSRRSESGSPTSQKLSSSQARLIAEQLGSSIDCDRSVMDRSPSNLQTPQAPTLRQLKQRSRSTTSLASASARSAKTYKTAFYTARSTESRGSDKSTFSFARPRQFGVLSREGSWGSASSSRSPPSSADPSCNAKTSFVHSKSRPGSASNSTADGNSTVLPTRTNEPHRETVSIPQRIVLRPTAPNDVFHITVGGWTRLLLICAQYSGVSIEASDGENECKLLSVSVEEVHRSKFEGSDGSRPGSSEGVVAIGGTEYSESNAFIRLALSLHRPSNHTAQRRSKVSFFLPLPATLGGIVDILKQIQSSRSTS